MKKHRLSHNICSRNRIYFLLYSFCDNFYRIYDKNMIMIMIMIFSFFYIVFIFPIQLMRVHRFFFIIFYSRVCVSFLIHSNFIYFELRFITVKAIRSITSLRNLPYLITQPMVILQVKQHEQFLIFDQMYLQLSSILH